MSADTTDGQADNPDPKNSKPMPRRLVLEYNIQPINDLVRAIKEKATKQEEEDNNPNGASRRGANEQARANRLSIKTQRIYRCANKISAWAISINTIICAATVALLWFTVESIKTVRNQFEVSNQPYLEVMIDHIDPLDPNKNVTF